MGYSCNNVDDEIDAQIRKLAGQRWADIADSTDFTEPAPTPHEVHMHNPYQAVLPTPPASPTAPTKPASLVCREHHEERPEQPRAKEAPAEVATQEGSKPAPIREIVSVHCHQIGGRVAYVPYPQGVFEGELPWQRPFPPQQHLAKLFFGHVWTALGSEVLQWLVSCFTRCPMEPLLFAPEKHYTRDGWPRGCMHVTIASTTPDYVIYCLHRRVLFDVEGVWYAADDDELRVLEAYCNSLWLTPQRVRHQYLRGLPCTPLTVEFAHNGQ